MIILTNCLTDTPDEGALKVANSLIKRLKEKNADAQLISYERKTARSDVHLSLNKLMLSPRLFRYLWKSDGDVLYIPFPARMLPTLLRVFILSLVVKSRLKAVLVMQGNMNRAAKVLLKLSKAQIFSLSKESWEKCAEVVGERARYIKAGVDTQKFIPVSDAKKAELKTKYGIPQEQTTVVHVGHMEEGRNIRQLLKLDKQYCVLLVTSTFTSSEQDAALRHSLEQQGNIRIIDSFLPDIQEIYQLADVYFFPVEQKGHCIDAPLSVFEAASCNVPVVHTEYGELAAFTGKEGFYQIDSFDAANLNRLIRTAASERKNTRNAILEYDWNNALNRLCDNKGGEP